MLESAEDFSFKEKASKEIKRDNLNLLKKENTSTINEESTAMHTLRSFEIKNIPYSYINLKDIKVLNGREDTEYSQEDTDILESIFQGTTKNFSISKYSYNTLDEDKVGNSISYNDKEIYSINSAYQLKKLNCLLPNIKHISPSLGIQKMLKFSGTLSHQILLGNHISSSQVVDNSMIKDKLENYTIFHRKGVSKVHGSYNLTVFEETIENPITVLDNDFVSAFCRLLKFILNRKISWNQFFEIAVKMKPECFLNCDAVVPDNEFIPDNRKSFLQPNNEFNFNFGLYENNHNVSYETFMEEKNLPGYQVPGSSSTKYSDCNVNSGKTEIKTLINFIRFLNRIKAYNLEHFNSIANNFENYKNTDHIVPSRNSSLYNADLFRLWEMLQMLAHKLGNTLLNQLLSGILSLTEDKTLDNIEIKSIIDQFLLLLASYYEKKIALENSCCSQECYIPNQVTLNKNNTAFTQYSIKTHEPTYKTSNKACSFYSSQETSAIREGFKTDAGKNEMPDVEISHENEQNEAIGDTPVDDFNLKTEYFELQNTTSSKNMDNQVIDEDQLVPNPPTEKTDTEHHDRRAELLWNDEKDKSIQTEVAHKNSLTRNQLCRPIRLGLSRRQRIKPLHPYLTIRHQIRDYDHFD